MVNRETVKTASIFLRAALCLILCAACLFSCAGEMPADPETGVPGSGEDRTENESDEASVLEFLTLTFADGDTADHLLNDFPLPAEVMGQAVVWTSSDPSVISISEDGAKVTRPAAGSQTVVLTARTANGEREFSLTVFPDPPGSIRREGDTLIPEN